MFLQGGVVRLGGCDPAQQLLRLLCPRSARGSDKNVVHPTPHCAASARFRSLEVSTGSAPKVAGRNTCRSSVWPWTVEVLFAGNVLARWCSSAWRMRSSPAAPSLAFPRWARGSETKCCAPHAALCSFCPLPQPCSLNWKCSEGRGMPHKQKFRVALVS
jgi:hypothetical protein